jgi:F0F1-type ATP synthase membrane subunit a
MMHETTEETKSSGIWQKVKILSIPVALLTGILIVCSGIFLVLLYIVLRPKSTISIPNKDQFTLATIGDWVK